MHNTASRDCSLHTDAVFEDSMIYTYYTYKEFTGNMTQYVTSGQIVIHSLTDISAEVFYVDPALHT